MNYIELRQRLIDSSPFILRKKVEKEEHLHFEKDEVVFNEKIISRYNIEEKQSCYCITFDAVHINLKAPALIALSYNEKPVIVTCEDNFHDQALTGPSFDSLLKFIPHDQFLADEKAEL